MGAPAGRLVESERLREEILSHGISMYRVARECGWMRKPPPSSQTKYKLIPDVSKVRRVLGLKRNGMYRQKRAEYATLLEIVNAFPEIDPVDVGF